MSKKTAFFLENNLFNRGFCDFVWYYHPKSQCFELMGCDEATDDYIEVPYYESFRKSIWRQYYQSLNDEEYALATDFDEKEGYFDYMRTTGLIGYYEQARELVEEAVIHQWQIENGFAIDLNCVKIR